MKRILTALAVLLATPFFLATAQTTIVDGAPVVIHPGAAGAEGVVTDDNQILVRQRVTAPRAAVLEEQAGRPSGSGRDRAGFEAGEKLFGLYDGDDAWVYCATRGGFFGDWLTCYRDSDRDGRFESAAPSGAPFLGVPFFIFAQRESQPLAAPAAYRLIPFTEGPAIEAGVRVQFTPARTRRGVTEPANIALAFGYIVENRFVPISGAGGGAIAYEGEGPVIAESRGARIEFSGPLALGALRYRVLEPMKSQLDRVQMTQTLIYR